MQIVQAILAFTDNYIWLLKTDTNGFAIVVDPGDASPVLETLGSYNLELTGILVTHHHADHTGGIAQLRSAFPKARVYGPDDPRIPEVSDPVSDGTMIACPGLTPRIEVMEIPGHTSTHVAYRVNDCLFCGDTLFGGGCGRVFDGSFEQLSDSLDRIAGLPGHTLIYCAHEYTVANLQFAAWLEPGNHHVRDRMEIALQRQRLKQPTLPSTLDLEMTTNPFLRTRSKEIIGVAEQLAGRRLSPGPEVFKVLRLLKNQPPPYAKIGV